MRVILGRKLSKLVGFSLYVAGQVALFFIAMWIVGAGLMLLIPIPYAGLLQIYIDKGWCGIASMNAYHQIGVVLMIATHAIFIAIMLQSSFINYDQKKYNGI